MKKSFKGFIVGTISIVLLTTLTWWILQHFNCCPASEMKHSYAHTNWVKELKLSKKQQSQLAALEQNIEPQFQKTALQLSQVRLLLCDLLRTSELQDKDLDKYTREIGGIQAQEEKLTVLHLLNIKKILTPEQDQKFFTVIMRDICAGCKHSSGTCDCQCGFCDKE